MATNNNDDITKRMNYFDRQFLRADDFKVEQAYHIDRRRRHNKGLHTWGIVEGLEVEWSNDPPDNKVNITEGWAVDDSGREIILIAPRKNLSTGNKDVDIYIAYHESESPSDLSKDPGVAGKSTRIHEQPVITLLPSGSVSPENAIYLATVLIEGPSIDTEKRKYAGVQDFELGDGSVTEQKLAESAVTETKLANNAISSNKIKDVNVTTAKLADSAVTSAKIATNAITSGKLGTDSVTKAKISNNSVSILKMDQSSITIDQRIDPKQPTIEIIIDNIHQFDKHNFYLVSIHLTEALQSQITGAIDWHWRYKKVDKNWKPAIVITNSLSGNGSINAQIKIYRLVEEK